MTISEVLALAAQLGVVLLLAPDGEHIQIRPKRRATPDLRAGVLEQKAALLASLGSARGPPVAEGAAAPLDGARRGLPVPNTTPVPDVLFDHWLAELNPAELRVLLYLIRRTYGFRRLHDRVSLTQICAGIITREGVRLDHGTGLSRQGAVSALAGLERRGLIIRNRADGRGANEYTIHVQEGVMGSQVSGLVK